MNDGIDVSRARAETPGVRNVLHFNNAGAGLMPGPVLGAAVSYLEREAEIGGYETADEREAMLEGAYDSAARLLNSGRDEIAFVENATRAWDMAFYGLAAGLKPGDRILTARSEYASNVIALLQAARRAGASVEVIPSDETGQTDATALAAMLDDRVRLVAISHVPTNSGLVNPAEAIGRVTRAAGVPYLLDACQSVGQFPVDVEAIGCDLLSATGRKYLRGPRGTGFLYVRRETMAALEPPFLDLHAATWTADGAYEVRGDARRFENWETNYAGRAGLAAAIDYALGWGMDEIGRRVFALGEMLREGLAGVPGVKVRDIGAVRCGIVTFTRAGFHPDDIQRALAAQKINVTTSSRFSTRYDMEARDLDMVVRASVHYYNDEREIGRFCDAVAGLA
ncbi:MAG: aminotransferase class V-fold PLP-dependent enzyme [Chloroflexota bacterium]